MTHTGTWKGRTRMAWATWILGAGMIAGGGVGLFFGAETGMLIGSGTSMVTLVVMTMVAGKVQHDRNMKGPGNDNSQQFP